MGRTVSRYHVIRAANLWYDFDHDEDAILAVLINPSVFSFDNLDIVINQII